MCERFGPGAPSSRDDAWFAACAAEVSAVPAGERTVRLRGDIGSAWWDLAITGGGPPLWTFPRSAWERELLPAAQVVTAPAARFDGLVTIGGGEHRFSGIGALSRIYGHGNAARWAWLHADLGGGDLVEVVTAVSRRPGLRLLPPVAFVRFRIDGDDLPRTPMAAARTRLGLPSWTVRGWAGRERLEIAVDIPDDHAVTLRYQDPDGASARCTNSERASATIRLGEREWRLDGTAHAELGRRH